MHRIMRTVFVVATLAVTTAPVSAQILYDNVAPGSGAFIGGTGGYGQIMQVGTTTSVTRLGFRLQVVANGTQNFTAFIATAAAPGTRLWEQSFARAVVNDGDRPFLVLTDALSVQLNAGTQYLLGFYATGGTAGYGWVRNSSFATQGGFTPGNQFFLNSAGVISAPSQPFALGLQIQGTAVTVPPTPPDMGVIPEPSTYALMATGLAGLAALRRRRAAVTA